MTSTVLEIFKTRIVVLHTGVKLNIVLHAVVQYYRKLVLVFTKATRTSTVSFSGKDFRRSYLQLHVGCSELLFDLILTEHV